MQFLYINKILYIEFTGYLFVSGQVCVFVMVDHPPDAEGVGEHPPLGKYRKLKLSFGVENSPGKKSKWQSAI